MYLPVNKSSGDFGMSVALKSCTTASCEVGATTKVIYL